MRGRSLWWAENLEGQPGCTPGPLLRTLALSDVVVEKQVLRQNEVLAER